MHTSPLRITSLRAIRCVTLVCCRTLALPVSLVLGNGLSLARAIFTSSRTPSGRTRTPKSVYVDGLEMSRGTIVRRRQSCRNRRRTSCGEKTNVFRPPPESRRTLSRTAFLGFLRLRLSRTAIVSSGALVDSRLSDRVSLLGSAHPRPPLSPDCVRAASAGQ